MSIRIIAFILLGIIAAQARIGETPQQIKERYGEPMKSDAEAGVAFFMKGGLNIMVIFHQGVCGAINFTKSDKGEYGLDKELTQAQIEIILKANAGNSQWTKGDASPLQSMWARDDAKALAQYDTIEGSLTIMTKEYFNHIVEEKKQKEAKKLEGF